MNPEDSPAIASYYDSYSDWYDSERRVGYYESINRLEVEWISRHLDSDTRALEVGPGTGLLLEATSRQAEVVGADLSLGMAKQSAAKGLSVVNASATELPFSEAAFDVTYSCKVLAHVPDIGSALIEIARVTRPGGTAVLEFYNPTSFKRLTYWLRSLRRTEDPVFVRFDSLNDVKGKLPPALEVVASRGVRTLAVTRHFYTLPVVGPVVRWLDGKLCDTWLGRRFGGYLMIELKRVSD